MASDNVTRVEEFMVLVDLKSYERYYDFTLEAFKNGYYIVLLSQDYRTIISILNGSLSWSLLLLVITAFFILSITSITTMMLLNSRKYEMAVMRSVGLKKSRLIFGCLIENLVFIWGTAIVSVITAQVIYFVFIAQKITGDIDISLINSAENTSILIQNITLTFGAATLVVILSSVLSVGYIIRFEPLKIFNKQY